MAVNILTGNACQQRGFTYMGLLMVLAIASIAMAGLGIVWHQDMQREREKELKFIGGAYRKAIGSYYESQVNGTKKFPEKLQDLVLDERSPTIKRHIRTLYADPLFPNPLSKNSMSLDQPWGLVLQAGRIIGVYSQSNATMIQQISQNTTQKKDVKYSDLKFVYVPLAPATPAVTKVSDVAESDALSNLLPQIPEAPLPESKLSDSQLPQTLNQIQSINAKPAAQQ